ncbi:MAG: polysaccharide lyase family 8 super-sandwich domain-containing protein [Opitutaceae bacterium]
MKITLSALMCVFLSSIAYGSNEGLIRKQFIEYFTQQSLSESAVKRYLNDIREDGTWADIDYTSQRRGNWPTRSHLDRLNNMASRYMDPASVLYQQQALKDAVLSGVGHWIEKDYRNPNWYNERIGVPYRLGSVLILMGDVVPDAMLQAARPILYRSELGMTGQNKVWCAGIGVMKGVLYADHELLENAVEDIWSELRVSTGEGIQPDWSFHQHGPQQQFGNYGRSFGDDMVQWASVLRGTKYALTGATLETLRNYLLEGPSWILWNGRMDFSGLGRQVDKGSQQSKARAILRQLEGMQAIDPPFAQAYASTQQRVGFKSFWRSEMAVQRRPDWYASVKLSSTRVVGAESCNSENMLGLHMGDGVLLTHVEGDEYEDLMPLWDWKCLPGTTCDQGLDELLPPTLEGYGGSDFSGVIGSGNAGVAAMVYKRNQLIAQKSWFFLDDHIVCLGVGIAGQTQGEVITSVEQGWLKGKVEQGDDWVWHNNISYQFLKGRPEVQTENVVGNWNTSFPMHGDHPASGEVFSLWLKHGKSPSDGGYAYRVFPAVSAAQMKTIKSQDCSQLLMNSATVQAIEKDGVVYAVFYQAGKLKLEGEGTVEVNSPCLLIIESDKMIVADPTHSVKALEIQLDGKLYSVDLPQGAQTGSQVKVKL